MRIFRWLAVGVALVARVMAAVPVSLGGIDAVVERVRKEFEVPGLAVAVVKDGEVLLARGYGVRKLGEAAPVDAHTRFAIASNTKAFTAAALAILVDEGKLKWGDRVIEHLPWFQMADPYVTREMTLRDLFVHRSGLALGAGDLLYWPASTYSTEEIARRLRHVPLATSFRANYAYDNILYLIAGLALERVGGRSWAEFVRTRILEPVRMGESSAMPLHPAKADNVATGHAKFDFKELRPLDYAVAFENNPAAATIHSSVHDLAKWMRVQLAGGRIDAGPDGARSALFTPARQKEMWSVVTPMPLPEPRVAALAAVRPNFLGYGLGWVLADFRGQRIVYHTGGWPGMVSRLTLVPERNCGVVVLTNQETGAAFNAVTLHVLDALLGAAPTDWVAAYAEAAKRSASDADTSWRKHMAARDADAKLALPLARFAGRLRDAWYGDVIVAEEAGRLTMRFEKTPQLIGDLEHWQHQAFIVRWRDRSLNADAWVTFALTPDAKVESAKMSAISPLTDFSFDFHHLSLVAVEK